MREQAHEHALEHRILARDHPPYLEERLLELLPCLFRLRTGLAGALDGHWAPFSRSDVGIYESSGT